MAKVKPIQDGYHTIIPHLVVRGASQAIDFYKKAFGAEEIGRMPTPDGKLMHAQLKFGDSLLFLCDEFSHNGWTAKPNDACAPVTLHLNVADADAVFQRAVDAGAKVKMPLADMFWGDRYGKLVDPFGQEWSISTHQEDVTPEEMKKRGEAMFAKMAVK